MENPEKLSSSKDVISYLAEHFPACFSLQGNAKPLKIGIFQDLADQLKEEPRISNTLLRSSLRHYTNSWRYLSAVKEGVLRVDLQGQEGEAIEKEHADFAQKQLEESKARAAERRKEQVQQRKAKATADGKDNAEKKFSKKYTTSRPKSDQKTTRHPKVKRAAPQKLTDSDLVAGTQVTVKLGKTPMPATITEVGKDGIHVQLDTGMAVKVQADALRLATK